MFKSIITDQISMDLEEALQVANKHDYSFVEIHSLWGKTIESLTNEEVLKVQNLLKKYEMKVSCLATTIFFMCPLYEDYSLENFNPKFITLNGNFENHIEGLKRASEISKMLDAPYVRVFPFRLPSNKKIVVNNEDIELITEKINTAAKIAEALDTTLALENCPHSHMPKGVMTKKVVDSIKSNSLKLLWDIGNSFRAPIDGISPEYGNITPYEELDLILSDIRHIHIKDYTVLQNGSSKEFNHITFGCGSIDFDKILKKLNKNNYKYALSLESEVNYEDTINSMINLQDLLTKVESEE